MEDQEITLPPAVCKVLKVPPGKHMYTTELIDRITNWNARMGDQEYMLSKQLSQFVGLKGPCTKDVPMKRVIRYIKTHNLDRGQDWSIVPDAAFGELLGEIDSRDQPLTFANLKKYILKHLTPVSTENIQVLTSDAEMQTEPLHEPEEEPIHIPRKQLYKWFYHDMIFYILSIIV